MESGFYCNEYDERKKINYADLNQYLSTDAEYDIVIEEGILFCNRCFRFFP